MVKHTQIIRLKISNELFECAWPFCGLDAQKVNAEESEPVRAHFLHNYNPVNVIHENTCYKSMNKSTCIDFIITNGANSSTK